MTLWLLFIALLSTAIGQSVVMTLLPPLGREVGLSELQVATILSSSALIFAVGTTLWNRASQRYGRKRILLVGLSGYTLGTLLFASMFFIGMHGVLVGLPLFVALLLSRSLQSTIMSASPPSALGIAVSLSGPGNRLAAISRVTSANSLGQVLGPALGGTLATFGLLVPLYTIAALTCVALVLIALKLPSDKPSPEAIASAKAAPPPAKQLPAATTRYLLIAATLFAAMAMVHQTLGFYFMDALAMTPVQAAQRVGFAAMTIALVSVLVQFGFVQRSGWPYARMLGVGLVCLFGGYALLASFQHLLASFIAMALLGMGMGLSYPATATAATSSVQPAQEARATALLSAAPAMGFVVGPPVAALLYRIDAIAPFVLAAGLMLLLLQLARSANRATPTH